MDSDSTHYVVKMISGDFILGRMEKDTETETHYRFEFPMLITFFTENYGENASIYLSPLNPFAKDEFVFLKKEHVMLISAVDDTYCKLYEKYLEKKKYKLEPSSRNIESEVQSYADMMSKLTGNNNPTSH